MSKSKLFRLNLIACIFSVVALVFLILRIPGSIIPDLDLYRVELSQRVQNEQDIEALKQLSNFKFSYLLSSNELCQWIIMASLIMILVNTIVLGANCWLLKREKVSSTRQPMQ